MRLVGHISKPSSSLERVLGAPSASATRPPAIAASAPARLANGAVQRAAVKVLSAADGPMRLREIRSAVDNLLGQPVSIESLSWSLCKGCRGERPRFERVVHGVYRLRDQS
jgi:hypothetical protein